MKCSPLEPMIKTAAFFIASFVLAGLLAACDKKEEASTNTAASNHSSTATFNVFATSDLRDAQD